MDFWHIVLFIIAGIVGGVIGGMGMGGGTLLIPILTLLFSVDQKVAQGVNLIVFIPMAIISTFIFVKNKMIKLKPLLCVAVPALFTTVLSAILVKNIQQQSLSRAFGIFLSALGAVMLIGIIVKKVKDKKSLKASKEEKEK